MNDQISSDQSQAEPGSKKELLERIHRSRSLLEATLNALDADRLTRPGSTGWAVKDHLAHLAVWELGVAELLRGRPRFAAMQVEEVLPQGEDKVNDQIYRRFAGLSLSEVMVEYQSAHRQMLEALSALEEEDLIKPYSSFVPDGSQNRPDPVIRWIIGNTYEHFDEHHGYIRTLLQELPAKRGSADAPAAG